MTEIGDRIAELMQRNGTTAYRLAKDTGVSYTGVTKILNGSTKSPQIESLSAIADYFGVSLDYLRGPVTEEPAGTPAVDEEAALFFRDFLEAPEEKRAEMLQFWAFIRSKEKGRKHGDRQ